MSHSSLHGLIGWVDPNRLRQGLGRGPAADDDDATASLDLALSVADYFELSPDEARTIAGEVGEAVSSWRDEAAVLGLATREIERMKSAFEHEDLDAALQS